MDIKPLSLNGHTYTMRPLDPLVVLQDSGRLGEIASGAFAKITKDDFETGAGAVLPKIGVNLVAYLKHPEFLAVLGHLFDSMAVDGKEFVKQAPGWQLHFTGKVGDLPTVIGWAIEGQFADFFAGAKGGIAAKLSSLFAKKD
jgi:hypothetical protein